MDVQIIINDDIGILGVFTPEVSIEDVTFYAEYWKKRLNLDDYVIVNWVLNDQDNFNIWKQTI